MVRPLILHIASRIRAHFAGNALHAEVLQTFHNRRCPHCGAAFTCEHEAGLDPCWCSRDFPPRLPLSGSAGGCLCPRCLAEATKSAPFPGKTA